MWIDQLIEDGKVPPPEGGLWGTNESIPVALWPDPDDASKADVAKEVAKERVSVRKIQFVDLQADASFSSHLIATFCDLFGKIDLHSITNSHACLL